MDVDARQLSDWSQDNTHILPAALSHVKGLHLYIHIIPELINCTLDCLMHIAFDPQHNHIMFLQSLSQLVFVDLSLPVPSVIHA